MSSSQETQSSNANKNIQNRSTATDTISAPIATRDTNFTPVNEAFSNSSNEKRNLILSRTNSHYLTSVNNTFVETLTSLEVETMASINNNNNDFTTPLINNTDVPTPASQNVTDTVDGMVSLTSTADAAISTIPNNNERGTMTSQTNFSNMTSLNNSNTESFPNNNSIGTTTSTVKDNYNGNFSFSTNNLDSEELKMSSNNNSYNSAIFYQGSFDNRRNSELRDPEFREDVGGIGHLCNFTTFIESIGEAVNHVTEMISNQYSKFVKDFKESNCPPDNDEHTENRSDFFNGQHQGESTLSLDFNQTMKALELFESIGAIGNEKLRKDLEDRVSELEEGSLRQSMLLNESYKCYSLLTKRIRSFQDDFKVLKNELQQIKYAQDVIKIDQGVIKKYLREIKSGQEQMKIHQSYTKNHQDIIENNQGNSAKSHTISSKNVDTTTSAENATNSSKPSLSFYNFNCTIPTSNTVKHFDLKSKLSLLHMLNSKESFKSTLDYFYELDCKNDYFSTENFNNEIETGLKHLSGKVNGSNDKEESYSQQFNDNITFDIEQKDTIHNIKSNDTLNDNMIPLEQTNEIN